MLYFYGELVYGIVEPIQNKTGENMKFNCYIRVLSYVSNSEMCKSNKGADYHNCFTWEMKQYGIACLRLSPLFNMLSLSLFKDKNFIKAA